MNSEPAISVVIPLYDKADFVSRAIRSVIAQDFAAWELIVVDDGSTDGGPEIVRAIADPRIRIVEQPNAGVSAARNRGVSHASAEFVAFLDADDEWLADHLATLWRLRMAYPQCDVLATRYLIRDGRTADRPAVLRGMDGSSAEGVMNDYFKVALQSEPPLWSSAVAVTKKALQTIGGFPVGIGQGEDLLTWARLATRFSIAYSVQPSAVFWQTPSDSGLPTRRPEMPDRVAEALRQLLADVDYLLRGPLRRYLGLWHKMRGTMFLRLGERRLALSELLMATSYSGPNKRLLTYILIALLPLKLGSTIARRASIMGTHWRPIRSKPVSSSVSKMESQKC